VVETTYFECLGVFEGVESISTFKNTIEATQNCDFSNNFVVGF